MRKITLKELFEKSHLRWGKSDSPLYHWELAEIRLCKFLIFIEVIVKGIATIAFPLGGRCHH